MHVLEQYRSRWRFARFRARYPSLARLYELLVRPVERELLHDPNS